MRILRAGAAVSLDPAGFGRCVDPRMRNVFLHRWIAGTQSPARTACLSRGMRRRLWPVAAALFAGAAITAPADLSAQIRISNQSVTMLPAPGAFTTPSIPSVGAAGGASTAGHPLFRSNYMGEEDQVVATSRFGPVTSRDLYLWLIMRDSPTPFLLDAYYKARTQAEKDALARTLRSEIDEFVFTNYVIPEIMGQAPCDAISGLREQLHLLPAYQLVYILRMIKPQICIEQADRQKFLQEHRALFAAPERSRVRYIRLNSTFTEPIEEQDRVEARIVDLRQQIAQGDISFAEAARRHSQAPSAERGGEIPPIRKGELFFFFEEAVAALEPGEVSPPFRGPDGSYYLVQLLEKLPPQEADLADPQQASRVDDMLWRKVLAATYKYENQELFRSRRPVILTSDWDARCDDDLVAYVGDFGLTKGQIRNAFPHIESEDLRLRHDLLAALLKPLLERAAMAQEVTASGCADDPLLQRSRWIAANLTRRDAFAATCEAGLDLRESTVRSFWRRNPELFTPVAMKRIFKVSLVPTNVGPPAESLVGELARVLTMVAEGESPRPLPPAVVASPGSVVDAILSGGGEAAQSLFGLPEAIVPPDVDPAAPLELDPDIAPIETTGTLQIPQPVSLDSRSTSEPVLAGLDAATTSVVPRVHKTDSAAGLKTTSETINLATSSAGGAAPAAAAGGVVAAGAALLASSPVEPAPIADPATVPIGEVPPNTAVLNPCCPPEAVPPLYGNSLGDFVPELPRAMPCPASIPFNPDLAYPKLSSREMIELFATYVSADFAIRVEDMGFMYVQDNPAIPKQVARFSPGTFSFPVPAGPGAVSYYVANSKRPERPPFEAIRQRVYATYRTLQVNRCIAAELKKARAAAKIEYRF